MLIFKALVSSQSLSWQIDHDDPTTFGGIALVRFVSPLYSWLVLASGLSLFLCYVAMVILIVKELWFTEPPMQ